MKSWIFVVSPSDFYDVASSSPFSSYKIVFSPLTTRLHFRLKSANQIVFSDTYDISKRVCFRILHEAVSKNMCSCLLWPNLGQENFFFLLSSQPQWRR